MNSAPLPCSPRRIVASYLLCGATWILFSDLLEEMLVPAPYFAIAAIAKGWIFIALTAALLYHLIGRQLGAMAQITLAFRENAARLQALGDNLPDSYVYQYLRAGENPPRFLYLSAGFEKIHGLSRSAVLEDAGIVFAQIDPDQLSLWQEKEKSSWEEMADFNMEMRICRADGEWCWLQFFSRPQRRSQDEVLWDGVATDITAHRQLEFSLRKLNRTYALLSTVNEKIVRIHDPQQLCAAICSVAVEQGGFCLAWIGLLDPQSQEVRTFAHAGRSDGYLEELKICLAKERSAGPTAAALRTARFVVVNDIAGDPDMAPWRAAALARGFRSTAAFPFRVGGEVRGTLNLYAAEPGFFDDAEAQLFANLAENIAFALDFFKEEQERKDAEVSLQEQKRFADQLLENSATPTFVLNPQHQVILWNRACEELTGMAASVMLGSTEPWRAFYDHQRPCLSDIALGAKGDEHLSLYEKFSRSKIIPGGVHAEGWLKNYQGQERYLLFDVVPLYDARGGLLAAIETIQDLTEKKRADADLRLQGAALQAAANAIAITDRDGTIEWVNPAFTSLTGYAPAEVLGKNSREVVKSGTHSREFYQELWTTLLAGEVWRGEIINRHKNGTLYPEGQTIAPVKDERGEITNFIAIKRDLTEQRKLEGQLFHSQKMESIGTLAGGIAHDFNNILTAIIGYGTLTLMKMEEDDPHRLYIQHMLEASERAAHLTKSLLLFSRKQVMECKTLDLNTVVVKVEKFLKIVIGEDIECKTVFAASPLLVYADSFQLEQVLMNLGTNARDAMLHGGTLTLTTEKIRLNAEFIASHGFGKVGSYVLITVTDTGIGMDEATQLRIFEPFFTTKEVGKGTGLGLAMTYGIIKQHDGYINVCSEPGAGTTFQVYLPLVSTAREEGASLPAAATLVGGSETILLAEDDASVRDLTVSLLTEFGYTVITAADGVDAVEKFTAAPERIDLLFFDLIMPKMNGKEALDAIRKLRPGIKAIVTSGYTPDTLQQKSSLIGGLYVLTKPILPTTLLQKVRSVLDEGRV